MGSKPVRKWAKQSHEHTVNSSKRSASTLKCQSNPTDPMSDSTTCRETWERFEPKNSTLSLEMSPFLVLKELAKWDAINEAFFKLEWLQIQGWNKSFDLRKQIRSLKKLVTLASSN